MHDNKQASSHSNREGTRSQDTPPFDFPRLEVLISICQDWFSDCYFMNVVFIFWTNMTVCICIWIVRYVYSMTIIKYWHIRWITPNSILMVLLKGILSEFVYWEQEWEGILFPGATFIPTFESCTLRKYGCQSSWSESVSAPFHRTTRGTWQLRTYTLHTRLVESLHFVLLIYSYKVFIGKLSLRWISQYGRTAKGTPSGIGPTLRVSSFSIYTISSLCF